ncbi:MAG: DNA-binding response regulator [Gammaproteobacteria bacterium]|nr:DNA-binding response regulator [Gammaproteobacteria bacterium]
MTANTPVPVPRLLLIDDNISDLRVLLDMLAARQWLTTVAFSGEDGYHKACLQPPSLILLDVRMPGMDGFATCRRLKADPRTAEVPVIFLTAAEDKDDRLTGLGLGAVDYIIKPFASEEEVLARIGIHLQLARRRGQAETQEVEDEVSGDGLPPLVRAAMRLLEENLAHPPDMDSLLRQLGTNKKRLNEEFHHNLGIPPFVWLREQRLRLARELLANTQTSVADIAAYCGYANQGNFATAFREHFECTPREYRQQLREAALARELD